MRDNATIAKQSMGAKLTVVITKDALSAKKVIIWRTEDVILVLLVFQAAVNVNLVLNASVAQVNSLKF